MNYCFFLFITLFSAVSGWSQDLEDDSKQHASTLLSQKPVLFQENKGQFTDVKGELASTVLFKTTARGIDTYITTKGLVYVFSRHETGSKSIANQFNTPEQTAAFEMEWLQVHLEGAVIRPESIVKEKPGVADYRFFTDHLPDGIKAKSYEKITIKNVYPHIDWVLYGSNDSGMKYDFIVHPGADISRIRLLYEGEHPVTLNEQGAIQVQMRWGTITENAPVSFFGEERTEVHSAFKSAIVDKHHVRVQYAMGSYPKDQTLVIDPQLTWGTRFGGDGTDIMHSITHDSNDNIFITGYTNAPGFPVLDAGTYFQPAAPGQGFCPFILKFDDNGVLLWSTIYGKGEAISIACDPNDNVFITGQVSGTSFPVQNSGTYFQAPQPFRLFILKFDNAGNRLWATGYGGGGIDIPHSLTCDSGGNVFIAGQTGSFDFPVQDAGTYFDGTFGGGNTDAFLLKFDNAGNRLWGTYYGGNDHDYANGVSCDASGNIFVTGATGSVNFPVQNGGAYFDGTFGGGTNGGGQPFLDAFLLKFDNAGTRLLATYYGGGNEDSGHAIAVDNNGNVFVTGETRSPDFPLQDAGTYFDGSLGGYNDPFMLKFDNAGNRLWATYYGGSDQEWIRYGDRLVVDQCGTIYTCFATLSNDVQTVDPGNGSYFDGSYATPALSANPGTDLVLARFTNDGALSWATYLGGDEGDEYEIVDVDGNNNVFVGGMWGAYTGNLLVDPGNGAYFDATAHAGGGLFNDGLIFKFISDALVYTSSQTIAGCNCTGTATVNVMGAIPPFTYTWSNGSQTSNTSVTTNTATGLCDGNQWVEILSCGHRDTVFFTLVGGTPPVVALSVDDTTICPGACVNFSANTITGATYSWSFGDGSTSTQVNPVHCYALSGDYDVSLTISEGQGCVATQTILNYIEVYPSPIAGSSADPLITSISSPTVTFIEQASGEISWHWNFGDASESDAPIAPHTYTAVGNYQVSLVVANAFGCTDTAFTVVEIYDDFTFYAPNAFTPGDDGEHNNTWLPCGNGIDTYGYSLKVFNRWGELIWQTTNLHEGWDGTYNGKKAPDGVYTWTIKLSSRDEPGFYNGFVTLIR